MLERVYALFPRLAERRSQLAGLLSGTGPQLRSEANLLETYLS